jgi:NADH-quinone oxidoreductase subunit E
MTTSERVLTDEMTEAIQAFFPRYPSKQAVTLPALHVVNDRLRHVPLQAVVEIAELLDLAPAEIQDTLTFYGFFKQDKPHGEIRAWVCRSISCHLRDADALLEHMCEQAGIRPGETTANGKLTLEFGECLGACEHAPCMLAGDVLHKSVTIEQADAFLEKLK